MSDVACFSCGSFAGPHVVGVGPGGQDVLFCARCVAAVGTCAGCPEVRAMAEELDEAVQCAECGQWWVPAGRWTFGPDGPSRVGRVEDEEMGSCEVHGSWPVSAGPDCPGCFPSAGDQEAFSRLVQETVDGPYLVSQEEVDLAELDPDEWRRREDEWQAAHDASPVAARAWWAFTRRPPVSCPVCGEQPLPSGASPLMLFDDACEFFYLWSPDQVVVSCVCCDTYFTVGADGALTKTTQV